MSHREIFCVGGSAVERAGIHKVVHLDFHFNLEKVAEIVVWEDVASLGEFALGKDVGVAELLF